jgi:uncharacterized membrane protein YfcA
MRPILDFRLSPIGVHPAVASGTTACMVLFTSATATISYAIYGMLLPDYAIFCFFLGFVATFGGQTIFSVLMKRFSRHSYIAYCLGLVVAVSAVAMTAESVIALMMR